MNMLGEIRKYGTRRTEKLLALLGNPDRKLKIVHIAGTNGKGSTAAYVTNILVCAGVRVGTFTSPQVYSFEEQFLLDNSPVPREKLNYYFAIVDEAAKSVEDTPSPFERQTAAALLAFYKEGCEYAVLECGLGGRDDATNAISNKCVAVITSISLEHTAELGGTLTEICSAKSGIIKNCPVVVSAFQQTETLSYFKRFNPVWAGEGISALSHFPYGSSFVYKGREYTTCLNGVEQCYNAAAAIEACTLLGIEGEPLARGIAATKLLGRVQPKLKGGRLFILDGSHNPASFAPLCEGLKETTGERELVFGCLSDKDVESAASILSPYFSKAYVFAPNSPRAMDVDKIYSAFSKKINSVTKCRGVEEALQRTSARTVVICGSFTIIREASEWIEKSL